MNKKLQVFVSSTYTDLIEERQAAVQAILDAGHIPAGMELFKAGKSQMETIHRWIDDSDVYLLILGGRYGSIETDSGLSYTELEYRYALSKNMPVFAVVLSESFLTNKINTPNLRLSNVMEQIVPDKYKSFKSLVMSKIIREVDDCKDIKIAIHSTLHEFLTEYNLSGWIRNNANLYTQPKSISTKQYNNDDYNKLIEILKSKTYTIPKDYFPNEKYDIVFNALDLFVLCYDSFMTGIDNSGSIPFNLYLYYKVCPYYESLGLIENVDSIFKDCHEYQRNALGMHFYEILKSKNII